MKNHRSWLLLGIAVLLLASIFVLVACSSQATVQETTVEEVETVEPEEKSFKAKIGDFFSGLFGEELSVFICSMLPVIELRGAIPIGVGFGLPWWQVYLLSVLGNMVPVPIILLFVKRVIEWSSKSKLRILNKFAGFLTKKAEKNRARIEKYSFWGVCFFVAIPLPATGAWTGSLVCATIDMNFWKAFFSCLFGVMIAGVIVMLISYGAFAGIGAIFS